MTLDKFLKDVSVELAPVQRTILEDMVFHNNSMSVLPRGGGKTLLLALAALYIAMNNKNQRVCVASSTYRQVKWVFVEMMQKANLEATFKESFCTALLDNGSTIIGLAVVDITGRAFDYVLADEYQYMKGYLRDHIDCCSAEKVSIMISDDIGNDGLVYLIVNRNRGYKVSKYLIPDYPKGFYNEDIIRELEKYSGDGDVEK